MTQETKAISEVCDIIAGQHIAASLHSDVPDGTPYLTGPADFGDRKPIVSKWTNSPRVFAKEGDVLVTVKGSGVGKLNLGCDAAIGRQLMALRPKKGRITQGYLFGFLRSIEAKVHKMAQGAAIPGITKGDIASLKLYAPPLAEQKRIAAILDAADALRAKRRESLAQLDTLLQSTFLDLFGDPVTNPMGWEVEDFQQIGTSRLGKMLDKGKEVGDSQYPYLANTNVQWGTIILTDLRTMDFSESDRDEFKLENGDLLICEGGEVGRTAIWRDEGADIFFQKALHRVRLDRKLALPEYVYFYMWFMAKNGGFRHLTNTATIAHLTGVKLKRLRFPRPPLKLQQDFATIVESVEQQKPRQRAHLAELDTLFASLQQRAFNGDL